MKCKRCGCEAFCKSGFMKGKQRYLCKSCGMNQTEGDRREKHPESLKNAAISMYLEGCGFRRISRLLEKIFCVKINYQLVIHWVKRAGAKLISEKRTASIPVLEMDELYTYVKKNSIKSEYGLLLIETGCVLLDLRSETGARRL
jgi:transposase-like protein